ncbi:hypothetical protein [Rhodobaculum claviforme]|uniref:hypothetical protein n=1 Tax=Rhodobaculum claviforme TaxID=1549854 RepID=UPI001913628C|nr:hypothetical protein [Rhodobaculum claviforme]
MTDEQLKWLMEKHPTGNIHTAALELHASLVALAQEQDPEKQGILEDAVRKHAAALSHALSEDARGGEEAINDDVSHARN